MFYVPSLNGKPSQSLKLRERLIGDLGTGWDSEYWPHLVRPWSRGDFPRLVRLMMATISALTQAAADENRPYTDIILIGHSMGGILVRDGWLTARADMESAHGETGSDWSLKVRRLILLGAPNAGFAPKRLPLAARIAFFFARPFRRLIVSDLAKGSPYITDLRIRWVRRFRAGGKLPGVVQVLGGYDRLVHDEDCIDVLHMPGSVLTRIDQAGHDDLPTVAARDQWYPVLRRSVMGSFDTRWTGGQSAETRQVVMLLHGIRSGRYRSWVADLTADIVAIPDPPRVATPSYGYLSALGFAMPSVRAAQRRRFLDWYSRLHVDYPPEKISFAGHSNGTYILGSALREVPSMQFARIYLAGSVLPRTYPWTDVLSTRGQVLGPAAGDATGVVHSDRARHDLPVNILCSALRGLGMRDLGTAGFDGFDDDVEGLVQDAAWFPGGHGSPLEGAHRLRWVASFLSGRCGPCDPGGTPPNAPSHAFRFAGRLTTRLTAVVALAVLGGALWWLVIGHSLTRLAIVLGIGFLAWAIGASL